jgi:hypothetical protein
MSIESDLQTIGINMMIDSNPLAVTVSRRTNAIVNGARSETTSTHGPFSIALFTKLPKAIAISTEGVQMDRVDWSALAKSNADFKSGGSVMDTFTVSGRGTFRVNNVLPIETHGVLAGKLLLLELLA